MVRSSENSSEKKNYVIRKSLKPPDYRTYKFTVSESILCTVRGVALTGMLAYIFYRSVYAAVLLSPITVLYFRMQKEQKKEKRKACLNLQFKDAMQSVSAALQAGYSMENAVREACHDMENMYGKEGLITRELFYIREGLHNNRTLEELFLQLADRSGLEDIRDFVEVFSIAKRSGGDLPSVIRVCSTTIGDKIETSKEIRTLISSKRLESRIMDVIPCLMILYIDFSSPGFFDVLYESMMGRIIMTVCLMGYLGAILLSEKIMSIEV